MSSLISNHRIGAVSALSGVPVSTLRVWETRHAAFAPAKSEGRHRLYSDDDVLRASLIKQLTEAGHSISTLARLSASQLNALLLQQRSAHRLNRPAPTHSTPVTLAVVGVGMAARLESSRLSNEAGEMPIQITEILEDLDAALAADMATQPQVLMVRVNSLNVIAGTDIQRLVQTHRFQQAIVLYNFGQEPVVAALKLAGIKVRREPLSNAELGELINSVLWMDHTREVHDVQRTGLVPPRKYSDDTLRHVANISSQVLCECPRHVAELIAQLASFEQYSQDCLNKSAEDAHLHAYLSSVSGSARALFEKALEMVAQHENIPLPLSDTLSDTLPDTLAGTPA
jgi:DNA-binding transcriptional MerR regulator